MLIMKNPYRKIHFTSFASTSLTFQLGRQEGVCKILGLESFADFRIDSPFVPLSKLHAQHMRLQSLRARRNIEFLSDDNGRNLFLVRDPPEAAQPTPARSPTAASNAQRVEISSSSRSSSPLEQDFSLNRPHSPPPSHHPTHQCQPGYAPPPPPTIQIRPNSPTIQSHGTEFPLNCRSGSQGELPIQTPPDSPQPSQQSEADTTQQPAEWAPAASELANTTAKDLDLESSMQDPSPVQPYGHEPSHSAAETPCYAQQGNVPPHPPAIRTSPDTAPMQSHVARARSLESRPELHQVITREGSGNPRTPQSSEAYLSPSMPHPASARQDCPSPRTTPRVPVESRVTEPRTDVPVDASQAPEFGQGSSEPQDFEQMDPWHMIDNMSFDDEDPDFWRGWVTA